MFENAKVNVDVIRIEVPSSGFSVDILGRKLQTKAGRSPYENHIYSDIKELFETASGTKIFEISFYTPMSVDEFEHIKEYLTDVIVKRKED